MFSLRHRTIGGVMGLKGGLDWGDFCDFRKARINSVHTHALTNGCALSFPRTAHGDVAEARN